MANYIQIRAGAATPAIGDLQEFQLGYCTGDGLLYIGVPQSGNIVPSVVLSQAQYLSAYALKTTVLLRTNIEEFTPTTDYQPATKKYIDSSINNLITNELTDASRLTTGILNAALIKAVDVKDPDNGDTSRVSIDANGISAEKVNADALYTGPLYQNNAAPSFTGAHASRLPPGTYDFYVHPDGDDNHSGLGGWGGAKRTIAGMLDALPRYFDGAVVNIYLFPDVYFNETVTIEGFYGNGNLLIRNYPTGGLPTVNYVNIYSCTGIHIQVVGLKVTQIDIAKVDRAQITACNINVSGTSSNGILVSSSNNIIIGETEINAYHAIWANSNSRVYAYSCRGDCGYAGVARDSTVLNFFSTRPYGGTSVDGAATIGGSASEAHGNGYVAPPTPTTQTAQFSLVDSRTYRASPTNQWYAADHNIGYGDYDYGIQTGCMKFDLSALAGKTVLSARMRLLRRSNVGSSASETITVQTFTSPATLPDGNTSDNAPVRGGASASASIPRGVATWMDINPADVQAVINGSAAGLCLYTGSGGYGKCDGYGDATPAILEVTCQ